MNLTSSTSTVVFIDTTLFVVNIQFPERKSTRKATVEKSAETAKKIKERSQVKKKIPLKKNEYVKPTQEQLLKEAKITEQENIKSLGELLTLSII